MYLGPDTACSFSARSTVKYTGNNMEVVFADLALGKGWRISLEQGPRSLEVNRINGEFFDRNVAESSDVS